MDRPSGAAAPSLPGPGGRHWIGRTGALRIAIAALLLVALAGAAAFARGARQPGTEHVYLIVLENHSYSQIVGNPQAPYLNGLARGYGLATDYEAVAHPSQPNYVTMLAGSTLGVKSDDNVSLTAPTLLSQLAGHGLTWHVYAQDYPGHCYRGAYARGGVDLVGLPGVYARHHDPAMSFTYVTGDPKRCANVTSLASFDPAAASFELIVPNDSNDMHTGTVAQGDAFLRAFVPRILSSKAFGSGVLFITFDEGTTNAGGGGRVPLIVVRPGLRPGYRSPTTHTHRALLHTIEERFGLPCLAGACHAPAMTEFFSH